MEKRTETGRLKMSDYVRCFSLSSSSFFIRSTVYYHVDLSRIGGKLDPIDATMIVSPHLLESDLEKFVFPSVGP